MDNLATTAPTLPVWLLIVTHALALFLGVVAGVMALLAHPGGSK